MQVAVSAERAQATARGEMGQGQPGQGQECPEPTRSAIASSPADNGVSAPAAGQASQGGQGSQGSQASQASQGSQGSQASQASQGSQGSQASQGGRGVRPEPARQPGPAAEPERKARPVTPESAARPRPPTRASAKGNPVAGPPPRPRAGPRQASALRRLIATGAIAVALVSLAAACLGVAVARYLASSAAHADTVSPAIERAEAASRLLAATWVTREVSHAAVVACDPLMCAALTADGFPSRNVRVLGPSSTYPLTSTVVVVTQTVRDLFGSSFTSNYAPAVLAAFGSADASITVRVIASHGAAAYQAQLGTDMNQRKQIGSDLAQNASITVSAEAKKQLEAGLPDARLLLAITSLATTEHVDILGFGNIGPGADPTVPLRFADLAESDQGAGRPSPAYVRALRAVLGAISGPLHPTVAMAVLPGGQHVLRIEYTAPTPLNVLTSG